MTANQAGASGTRSPAAPGRGLSEQGNRFVVRRGTPDEADLLLSLFDAAVRWLTARGFTDQLGETPFSDSPRQVERCQRWAAGGSLWFCEADRQAVAALVLADAPPYVPPAT